MIKIIFSDIDGTFLTNTVCVTDDNFGVNVPALTSKAANSAVAKGIKFAFASARMPDSIYPITDSIKLARPPVVSCNGNLVLDENGNILFDRKVSKENTQNILEAITGNWKDITISYYSGRNWFVDKIDDRVLNEKRTSGANFELKTPVELLRENILPNKILIMSTPKLCEEMENDLQNKFLDLDIARSAPYFLEIMDKKVSKATGIEILIKHYNFTLDEVIVFGDQKNDIEMFKYVPQSVAMANAPDEVKKFAYAITDSVNESGIYTYLVKTGVIEP